MTTRKKKKPDLADKVIAELNVWPGDYSDNGRRILHAMSVSYLRRIISRVLRESR